MFIKKKKKVGLSPLSILIRMVWEYGDSTWSCHVLFTKMDTATFEILT